MIGIRKLLDFVFTREELIELDDIMPESTKRKIEEARIRRQSIRESMRRQSEFHPGSEVSIPLANGNVLRWSVSEQTNNNEPPEEISQQFYNNAVWKDVERNRRYSIMVTQEEREKFLKDTSSDECDNEDEKGITIRIRKPSTPYV